MDARIGKNVTIGKNVSLGKNVRIGDNSIVYDNVEIGDNVEIYPNCNIGFRHYKEKAEEKTVIGSDSVIRIGSILYSGSKFGDSFNTGSYVVVREKSIFGHHCSLGTLSQVEGHITVGDYSRFHTNVHLCQKAKIGDYVWIFPYTVLTNDMHPPCSRCLEGPTVDDYAVIATHCIVLPKVRVGKNSLVGAMSLVTKDVPDETVVLGIPAKPVGSIKDIKCPLKLVDHPYPWKDIVERNYPWAKR